MKREQASRAAKAPRLLRAPLKFAWREVYDGVIVLTLPSVAGQLLLVARLVEGEPELHAIDEIAGDTKWTIPGGMQAIIHNGIAWRFRNDIVDRIDLTTGKATIFPIRGGLEDIAVDDTIVVSDYDDDHFIAAFSITNATRLWEYRPEQARGRIEMGICADERGVYFAQADGSVAALSLDEGQLLWRQMAARYGPAEGVTAANPAVGYAIVYRGVVIYRFRTNIAGVSAATGEVLWRAHVQATGDGYLYEGRYYATTWGGKYFILDPLTGQTLFEADLVETLPPEVCERKRAWRSGYESFAPMLVSETHLYVGTRSGFLLAFERETGVYAWHFRPQKKWASIRDESYFVSANGRLYYADLWPSVICLEEEEPTDPVLKASRAARAAAQAPESTTRRKPAAARRGTK